MPNFEFTYEGKKYRVNGAQSREQATEFFKQEYTAGRIKPSSETKPAETKPTGSQKEGPMSVGADVAKGLSYVPGGGFLKDFISSLPQGMVKGATRAASRVGQAEEPLAAGAIGEASKPVPGPAQSAQLAREHLGADRLPAQAPGLAGSAGGFVGEVMGTPTTGLPGIGAKLLEGAGAKLAERAAPKLAGGLGKEIDPLTRVPQLPQGFFGAGRQPSSYLGSATSQHGAGVTLPQNKAANIIAERRAAEKAAAAEKAPKEDDIDLHEVAMKGLKWMVKAKLHPLTTIGGLAGKLAGKATLPAVKATTKGLSKLPKGTPAATAGAMYEE